MGQRVYTSTISRWIIGRWIITVYKESRMRGVPAHSLRSAATSVAYRAFPLLEVRCKAKTWKSAHSFTRHYRLDTLAVEDTTFSKIVLQNAL